ncbi:MAG: dihydrolipoyl dehydrogenase, partial [Gammaproteobacteria bacterium]|nr:dihydrolipoyl dehydrogenase [Gammaproteobacteria bacterium]
RVALVERYPTLGGVCLNVGCIPSKALLHAARVIEETKEMRSHGIDFGEPALDLEKLRDWKAGVVNQLTGGLAGLAKKRGVAIFQGLGRFSGPNTLDVAQDGIHHSIEFKQAIIAAGSQPVQLPNVPKDPRIVDSTGALALAHIPKRLLVIGGGIIGLEMATVYNALGSAVTIVEMANQLMPGTDADLVRPLTKRLTEQCQAIHTQTRVEEIEPREDALGVRFSGDTAPAESSFDLVLVAVGREANGHRIDAEKAGVHVDKRGFISVDHQMRTNQEHIFAIGDIVGQPMLAHKATHEAKVAAEVAAGQKSAFDARVIPSVAYTDPEVAWVGLTETEAKAQNRSYEKGTFPWAASGRALALTRSEGFTKLLFDPETEQILGGAIVGTNAGDLIGEVALAIEMNCVAADIGLTIHPHPTLAETVGLAAEAFEGTITDLYIPKKR